jgi:arabinogalactan oligomer/maltooligosaccharide transport system substrate-binding protein
VAATLWDGDVWGVPLSQEGIAIVYNKALIDASDLPSDPLDFAGLLAAAQAFHEANPDQYLLCNQGLGRTSNDAYHAAPVYFGFGGADEMGFIDDDGHVFVDTPERLAAAEWLVEFAQVSPLVTSHSDCLRGLRTGTYAAWWTGPWAIADLEAAGLDYGIVPFGRPFVSVQRLMMGTEAAVRGNEEAVIGLLMLLGSAEVQARLAVRFGTIPANTRALEMPEVEALYSVEAFGRAIANGIPLGNSPYVEVQWDPIAAMTRDIVSGQRSPAEALAYYQAELERLVAAQNGP